MIRSLFVLAALSFAALPAFAGEGCTAEKKSDSAWAKQIAQLEAKAAKGDKQAVAALDAGRASCGSGCNKSMTAKVVELEKKANAGDAAAKKQLQTMYWTMKFAAVRAGPLTEQAEFYAKACDHGCDISKKSLAVMMKETGAKDRAQLQETLAAWEAKASKGCTDCSAKIASLRAKLAPTKTATLSDRVGELATVAAKGDEAAKARLAKIAASVEAKPENVVATIADLEAKAVQGCGTCKTMLAKVEKMLSKSGCSDCSDCGDCSGCDKDCKETCPAESKPVSQ